MANLQILRGHPEFMNQEMKQFQATNLSEVDKNVVGMLTNFDNYCGVYQNLRQHIVILAAEPHIGKTSAVIALLGIISLLNTPHKQPENYFITGQERAITTVAEEIIQKLLEHSDLPQAVRIADCGNNHLADSFVSCLEKACNRDGDDSMGLATVNHNISVFGNYHIPQQQYPIEGNEIEWKIACQYVVSEISKIDATEFNYIVYCLFTEKLIDHYLDTAYKSLKARGTLYLCVLTSQLINDPQS